MAGTKFSAFTTGATTADTFIVGYDSGAGTNNQYTLAQLAAGLPVNTLYGANGTIGTTRKALITDTIQFRNAGDTSDIFKLNTDGTFALGIGASTTISSQVAIGNGATANGSFDIAIGNGSTASAGGGMAIGRSASSNENGISLGFTSASASKD